MLKTRLLLAAMCLVLVAGFMGVIWVMSSSTLPHDPPQSSILTAGIVMTMLTIMGIVVLVAGGIPAALIQLAATFGPVTARRDGTLEYDPRHWYWRTMRYFWKESWTNPISRCKSFRLTGCSVLLLYLLLLGVSGIGFMAYDAYHDFAHFWMMAKPMVYFAACMVGLAILILGPTWIARWNRRIATIASNVVGFGAAIGFAGLLGCALYTLATSPQERSEFFEAIMIVACISAAVLGSVGMLRLAMRSPLGLRFRKVEKNLCPYLYEKTS